ncbi:MAG: mannose-1-phosphate guanylyltransferase/mannose-6-phosphate isomerase [Zetaproteobacteria bacterium CG06_land_8_20_14_3_00_59_53]|nr:MAG: mannose-1-phosphate guanylyltransferase/mannose-6-phosphate isomerase [Zetaproteobacteria bacterium CG2_30_59_37]PIO90300.1 MAG: mannose-1-phosphate guanylyltransferase/mannose-6-phosphate isomerase [Zetaproteobacteria bacterium CG23_combo_of_CG06-09_8_20_14_all_59_86]PIQ64932.1 MAG: mannose-1-phosphate guanylyltransferase/mannose-6-phosphate isomerase [Zetaproteobacteria bacterium CG11_big_fil_rev_8_21_14_0_20_59_439]PIU69588.1 MAG: mannose-1-phosphate guanylyltransferase/mannose-6-phos
MSAGIKAVVLAGGSGSRLWPLSRQQLPKQFLKIEGEVSLLEATIQRLYPMIGNNDVWVVTGEAHASGEAYSELVKYNQILEPVGRNTAPAIALAAALLMEQTGADPVMVVLPADHIIKKPQVFRDHLAEAVAVAESGRLVTFGIHPERPDTGFGYIEVEDAAGEARPVKRFTEKPDLETAEGFLRQGNYYWNSGMFVWRASVILAEVGRWIPEIDAVLADMRAAWQGGKPWQEVVREDFERMPDISIDYGVLERSDKVSLIPCDIDWSDVGSWDAVHEISVQDAQGNVQDGDVIAIDCKNTLLRSNDRLLAAVGLEDVIVVETADAILLAKRGDSQRVREIVDKLKERGSREHIEHLTVRRPWGSYKVLEDSGSGYKMKRIEVLPGHSLSLQRHQHRSEHWVVVSGTATVTRGDETFTVSKNESTYIPIGVLHRLENKGRIPLQIVEVQVGEYVGEDDIERFGDSYGRTE